MLPLRYLACLLPAFCCVTNADDYLNRRDALQRTYVAQLSELADRCVQLGLPEQVDATRRWVQPRDPRRQHLFLPRESDPLQPTDDASRLVHQWHAKLMQYRRQHAQVLFDLARQELTAEHTSRAYQLLHEVLHEDPDHEAARAALGYRQVGGLWRKPSGTIRSRAMRIASPALGFAAGEYWVIESGNFRITTNQSVEAGQQLIEQLETLHAVWKQLFFPYWSNVVRLKKQFDGQPSYSRSRRRHEVVLFRDRAQYIQQLSRSQPRIDVTVGIYLEQPETAYFYAGDQAKLATCFHEVTHQLFSETGPVAPQVGLRSDFWILEGIALYMESLRIFDGYATVGGVDADRLQYARYRSLTQGFYLPLEQLVPLGRDDLQQHEDIRRLYSQAAGLTAFLADYRRGVHRESLVEYLKAVYAGRDLDNMLTSLVGLPLAELDQQYQTFLDVSDQDLAYLAADPTARNLSLGRTSVTDQGLAHLKQHTNLLWVDLAHTSVGDAGLACLKQATQLNHLIAEQSQITDEGLRTVGSFGDLEILDLTTTAVTDNGLPHLAELKNLKELWLGGTRVTDVGLASLREMKRLTLLDVRATGVTTEGWNQIKQELPQLEQ